MRVSFTYANVASTLALAVALGGGGVAVANGLARNSVGSPQVKNYSIKQSDLAEDSVGTTKIKPNGVSGADIRNGSLTGADIDQSTLYPSGGFARDTPRYNGDVGPEFQEAVSLDFNAPARGYLIVTVEATFDASRNGVVEARTMLDGSTLNSITWDSGDVDGKFDQHQSATSTAFVVNPGPRTLSLRMAQFEGTYATYIDAQISMMYVYADPYEFSDRSRSTQIPRTTPATPQTP